MPEGRKAFERWFTSDQPDSEAGKRALSSPAAARAWRNFEAGWNARGEPLAPASGAIHVRIEQGHELIVDLPEWPGPVPRVGEYIFHPPLRGMTDHGQIAGCVKVVTWRTHDRSPEGGFVMTARPYVELSI